LSATEAAFAFSETLRDFSEHKHRFRHDGLRTHHDCRRATITIRIPNSAGATGRGAHARGRAMTEI